MEVSTGLTEVPADLHTVSDRDREHGGEYRKTEVPTDLHTVPDRDREHGGKYRVYRGTNRPSHSARQR
ncbi:hypothetical protein DPMN_098882 [Dreissena polymorpha]|uniref:Uncharacterized protein n=1 Tax=Dreissena polymorpha TaxID=45954 RepID=A0A9D4LDW9_DREPO|nr:hypothetical protein DPMN_098882 [Dreissena polymorpha]